LNRHRYYLRTGPFTIDVETTDRRVSEGILQLYDSRCFLQEPEFSDFHVSVRSPPLRKLFRPKVEFLYEGLATFKPSPAEHALPMFEWGLNWVISTNAHQYLVIHAAVVERGGRALLLPGPPGSGKSTLCAGLVYRGWRLLSDELALIDTRDGKFVGLSRPISLKNESIDIIRAFSPGVVISRPAEKTLKGRIALSRPPEESFLRVAEKASPGWIVFPRYDANADIHLTTRSKAETFLELAGNALNYNILAETGFNLTAEIVTRSPCFQFSYGDLEAGVATLTSMADAKIGRIA
jgi:HprK-related kinase A